MIMSIIIIGGSTRWSPEMEIEEHDEIIKVANFEAPIA